MIVHDLGTLMVEIDDQQSPAGGNKPAAILSLLTINANRRVSVDMIIDAIWGESAASSKDSTLESHVWRLRQLLEPGRPRRQAPTVLINDAGGYRLLVASHEVDSAQFERLVADSRELLNAGRAEHTLARLDEALALWRGRPYSPLTDEEWAAPAVARLDELHAVALERRIEALLDLGRPDQALADLEPLIRQMPFRERLWAHRMVGLYRTGRAEAALRAYQDARTALLDEVGLEPGADLRDLQRRILEQDPSLDLPRRRSTEHQPEAAHDPTDRTAKHSSIRSNLPSRTSPLIGRDPELERLGELLWANRLVTITGTGGCGKTRLAIDTARTYGDRYPGGVWFFDLVQVDTADLLLDVVITTLGISAAFGVAPTQAITDYLQAHVALLVFDNCEHLLLAVAAVLDAILATDSQCVILATSREPIGLDGEVTWPLNPLALPSATLGLGEIAPSVQLFVNRVLAADPTATVDPTTVAVIERICTALDGLPLALELAAARARTYSLDEIADQVSTNPAGLTRVGRASGDHRQSLREVVQWSYDLITPAEQSLHRALSVIPGQFTRDLAEALIDDSVIDVGDALPMLVNRSLLTAERSKQPPRRTTFSQLVTVRAHAAEVADDDERDALADRRDRWVHELLDVNRPYGGDFDLASWLQRIDDNYPSVRATLQRALVERRDAAGARLMNPLMIYWFNRDAMVEGMRWVELATPLADQLPPLPAIGIYLARFGNHSFQGRADLGRPFLDSALALIDHLDYADLPEVGEILALRATIAANSQETELARDLLGRATTIAEDADDQALLLLCAAARCLIPSRDSAHAPVAPEEIYDRAIKTGQLIPAGLAGIAGCVVSLAADQPEAGLIWSDRVLSINASLGTRYPGIHAELRARLHAELGQWEQAVRNYGAANAHARRLSIRWPLHPATLGQLTNAEHELTRQQFDDAWKSGESLTIADIVRVAD